MPDRLKHGGELQYAKGIAITTSDTVDLGYITEAIYVGGAGNAVVVWEDGTTTTLTGLLAGHIYRLRAKRINSTNTTATALIALH